MSPFGGQAANLVVWWDEGYYAEESEAVAEVITAFEQGVASKSIFPASPGGVPRDNRGGARGRLAA
jgi:hypothetical protein